jgi:homoserine kinase
MTIRVRAPATTANLGAGFDVAGAALDLWNELEVDAGEGGEGGPIEGGAVDESHLGVLAFAVYASPAGRAFRFTDRIPRERGLGSSAAVVALGLVAGATAARASLDVHELLAAGVVLEGHADNLAPALAGGVCLTWDGRVERVADNLPAVPVAVIPKQRVNTAESRSALPGSVPRDDAVFSVVRATLLGAALARGDASLFAAAADDRLHEPYRAAHAPQLAEIRADLPQGAIGATLSGSGPTVLVWATPGKAPAVASELASRFPDCAIEVLAVSASGASVF